MKHIVFFLLLFFLATINANHCESPDPIITNDTRCEPLFHCEFSEECCKLFESGKLDNSNETHCEICQPDCEIFLFCCGLDFPSEDCGNGVIDEGEECDLGHKLNGQPDSCCNCTCQLESSEKQCRGAICGAPEFCNGINATCPENTSKDCSHLDDDCNIGVCNERTGECETEPRNEEEECSNSHHNPCIVSHKCVNGTCVPVLLDCSHLDSNCTIGICPTVGTYAGTCIKQNINEGGPCNDGNECTVSDICKYGRCVGTFTSSFTLSTTAPETSVLPCTLHSPNVVFENLPANINDPDETAGMYTWILSITSVTGAHSISVGAGAFTPGSFPAALVPTPQIRMEGGGSITVKLTVTGPCGVQRMLNFTRSRDCCGNGVLNTGEACDDGNTMNGDYCSGTCNRTTGFCGDGIVQSNELCDTFLHHCCEDDCMSLVPAISNQLCRNSFGVCDIEEYCDGTSKFCPDNEYLPPNIICRNVTGDCDIEETCTGTGPFCPSDDVAPYGTLCRPLAGICDIIEVCNGFSTQCPNDTFAGMNVLCRQATSFCDIPEFCNTTSPFCPPDKFHPHTKPCDLDGLNCTIDLCSGTDNKCVRSQNLCECLHTRDCPSPPICKSVHCTNGDCISSILPGFCFIDGHCFQDGAKNPLNPCLKCRSPASTWSNSAAGTSCNTTSPTGICSTQDTCDGYGVCIDRYLPSTTSCRAPGGPCGIEEFCSGDGDLCPMDTFKNPGVICREKDGTCDIEDTCSGDSADCPDMVHPVIEVCRVAAGLCDVPETCDGYSKDCPADVVHDISHMCRASAGVCDNAEFCDGYSVTCPIDQFMSSHTLCRAASDLCDEPETCTGSSADCPPDVAKPMGTTCRASEGPCDKPEICNGHSKQCPPDAKEPNTVLCRAAIGVCDKEEHCSGHSNDCPSDELEPTSTLCRPSTDVCDAPEHCDGQTTECPADSVEPSTTVCRVAAGPCDKKEKCDGYNTACPPDTKEPISTICRQSLGLCDPPEQCDGIHDHCPSNFLFPYGHICRIAAGLCDEPEKCNGVTPACPPDSLSTSHKVCRVSTGLCDAEETCSGSSPNCPHDAKHPSTMICRDSAGICDIIEYCDGTSDTCPIDGFIYAGTICRTSEGQCDVAEECTGSSADCPVDRFKRHGTSCTLDGLECTMDVCDGYGTCVLKENNCECLHASDCPPPATCIDTSCPNGLCQESIQSGFCFIEGECYPDGAIDPLNQCKMCVAYANPTTWTPVLAGTSCTDSPTPTGPCSGQDVCDGYGMCADRYLGSAQICRASAGICDSKEYCDGTMDACPPDKFKSPDTTCRHSTGACDPKETCTGSSAECPVDEIASQGTICRESAGPCDVDDVCDGYNSDCSEDEKKPQGYVCRLAYTACDSPEVCDGEHNGCPADMNLPPGTFCRAATHLCEEPAKCDGSKVCPENPLTPQGIICRPSEGPCDPVEVCDGEYKNCPHNKLADAGTVCRPMTGRCDIPDVCDGYSIECSPDAVAPYGHVCRCKHGQCDEKEICDGHSKQCPEDEVKPYGVICRPSSGDECDPAERCDGEHKSCPTNAFLPDGTPCQDGEYCSDANVCDSGHCVETGNHDCDDEDPCTEDFFDDYTCKCIHIPRSEVGDVCCVEIESDDDDGDSYTIWYRHKQPKCENLGFKWCVNDGSEKSGTIVCLPEYLRDDKLGSNNDDKRRVVVKNHLGTTHGDDRFHFELPYLSDYLWNKYSHYHPEHTPPTHDHCYTVEDCPYHRVECLEPHCEEHHCEYHVKRGFCFINSTCFTRDQHEPGNVCAACKPRINQKQFSPVEGNPDDNNLCNGIERCRRGKIKIVVQPPVCNQEKLCHDPICHPTNGCSFVPHADNTTCENPEINCGEQELCFNGQCQCGMMIEDDDNDSLSAPVIVAIILGAIVLFIVIILCILLGPRFVEERQQRVRSRFQISESRRNVEASKRLIKMKVIY